MLLTYVNPPLVEIIFFIDSKFEANRKINEATLKQQMRSLNVNVCSAIFIQCLLILFLLKFINMSYTSPHPTFILYININLSW